MAFVKWNYEYYFVLYLKSIVFKVSAFHVTNVYVLYMY